MIPLLLSFFYLVREPITITQNSPSQSEPTLFFALIVNDIEESLDWYSSNLEFEILNQREVAEMELKQANLKSGNIHMELIELGSAINTSEYLPEEQQGKRQVGIFKIGFSIEDFDGRVNQLKESSVNFRGDVVEDPVSGKRMVILLDPDGNRVQLFE